MESLEQAEKRADAAEKVRTLTPSQTCLVLTVQELLVLRDREASLRRRLMEHWSGVMAWEVRRLERVSAEAQQRSERANKRAATSKAREEESARKAGEMEAALRSSEGKVAELEEIVVEMGRRERALEEDLSEMERAKAGMEREKEACVRDQRGIESERASWGAERRRFEEERQQWLEEKRMLLQDREAVVKAKAAGRTEGQMPERDQAMIERVRAGLGGMLGRKAGVEPAEMADAVDEAQRLLRAREDEVVRLKGEIQEINMGLEEEVKRATTDRDVWKSKVEEAEREAPARAENVATLEKQLRVCI